MKWRGLVGIVSVAMVGLLVTTLVLSPEVPGARDVHQQILKLLNRLLFDHRAMDNQLDAMDGQLDVIDDKLNDKPSIMHLTFSDVPIEGFFRIQVFCQANFQVKAVYGFVTGNETAGNQTDVVYTEVSAFGDFAGEGIFERWEIGHTDFDPPFGFESQIGYELLSQLNVELPVGVPGNGIFQIGGLVEPGTAFPVTLSAGVVVDTAQAFPCNMTILG